MCFGSPKRDTFAKSVSTSIECNSCFSPVERSVEIHTIRSILILQNILSYAKHLSPVEVDI